MTIIPHFTNTVYLVSKLGLIACLAISTSGCDKNPLQSFFSKADAKTDSQSDKPALNLKADKSTD